MRQVSPILMATLAAAWIADPAAAFADGCLQKFSCQLYGECRLPCLDELTGSAPSAPPPQATAAQDGAPAETLSHGRAVAKDDASQPARQRRKLAHHVAPKPTAPHVVAARDVTSLAQLAGKPVSFGPAGSASEELGRKLFAKLDIKVQETPLDVDNALDGVATGDVAAVLVVKPKDVARMEKLPAQGVHELAVPETPKAGKVAQAGAPTEVREEAKPKPD